MTEGKQTLPPKKELSALEARLAGMMHPVRPPQDSLLRLRAQIQFPTREELAYRLGDWRRLFLAFAATMLGMMALMTLARALYYFVGRKS